MVSLEDSSVPHIYTVHIVLHILRLKGRYIGSFVRDIIGAVKCPNISSKTYAAKLSEHKLVVCNNL